MKNRDKARLTLVQRNRDPSLSFLAITFKNGNSYYGTCANDHSKAPYPHGYGEKVSILAFSIGFRFRVIVLVGRKLAF
jgi:hypothetical protein